MSDIRALSEAEFPPLLSEIPDKPRSLYIRGALPPNGHKLLAVVGSRRMSRYGKDACDRLIGGLAGKPVSIVSGMALGIDAAAHRAALNAGLHTIAVLGSSVDDASIHPRTNYGLAQDILKAGGALISENAPGFKPRPESFPKRNRIVAGVSGGTLIVEAGERSGTLITAKLTSEYNRELLIVSHSIFSDGGSGGHIFMKLGGMPVRSATDILEALRLDEEETNVGRAELTPAEQSILETLSSPLPRDELIRTLNISTADANALLLGMELKGLIKETMGEIRKNI